MGRPPCDLEDYREWQQRLESHNKSDLDVGLFCLQEGVSKSSFYHWKRRLQDGIPESVESEGAVREQSELKESLFLPVSLKASRVEIELPNGGVLRLPSEVSKEVLVAVVRVVGSLRPWKAPEA